MDKTKPTDRNEYNMTLTNIERLSMTYVIEENNAKMSLPFSYRTVAQIL